MTPRAPYIPSAGKLARFWVAGPLTCLIFTPLLYSGVFGAPTMLLGIYFGWRLLRTGRDDFGSFAMAGGLATVLSVMLAAIVNTNFALFLLLFGLLFGPLMAMTFRAISGSWRPDPA